MPSAYDKEHMPGKYTYKEEKNMALDIKMTPDELRTAATNLEGKRDEILDLVEQIKSMVDETTGAWSGEAQKAFVDNFETLLPVLQKDFPEVISGIASQLDGAADALEQADSDIASALKG